MVPDFDQNGNLPPGVYTVTVEEVIWRFGGSGSLRRRRLTEGLLEFCASVEGVAVEIYINGSYVTRKLSPRDVDLMVIFPPNFDMDGPQGNWLERQIIRGRKRGLHIFAYRQRKQKQKIREMMARWTGDRLGNPKGILRMEMKG